MGGIETSFKKLSPLIGQVFFIGDGLTGTGTGSMQVFDVPPTATHLYLGYVSKCAGACVPGCYATNTGSLSVIFHRQDYQFELGPAKGIGFSARPLLHGPGLRSDEAR